MQLVGMSEKRAKEDYDPSFVIIPSKYSTWTIHIGCVPVKFLKELTDG